MHRLTALTDVPAAFQIFCCMAYRLCLLGHEPTVSCLHGQGSTKRQQPSCVDILEQDPDAGDAMSILCTAEQLASPVAAGSDAPAAQNLRAAVGTARAEAEQGISPALACNSMTAGKENADQSVSAPHRATPAAVPQHGAAGAPGQEAGLAAVACTSHSTELAGPVLTLEQMRAAEPDHGSGHTQSQPGITTPADSSPGSWPEAEHVPSSAPSGPNTGDRWHLQGVPSPAGSHVRFQSDSDSENVPDSHNAAPELEDSEVIEQLQFVADERGQVVISFNGRSVVDLCEPEPEAMQSHAQAGSRKRTTPTKAQRQW